MTTRTRIALTAAALLGLAGAAAAQMAPESGGADRYTQALSRDYEQLAGLEKAEGDHRDALTYAMRARAAASGHPSAPDEVALRQPFLKDKYVPELGQARERLVRGLSATAREQVPDAAARAQTSFDCWIEQAAEDIQPDDIAACRAAYLHAIAEVERAGSQVAATPAAAPPAAAPAPEQPTNYLVFFDWDKADITPAAREVLQTFRTDRGQSGKHNVLAIGHTDTSGSAQYNLGLSQRRAQAVERALQNMDVPAADIMTEARGETEPLVPTGDGVREPQNRRVELIPR
ncbi:MAG: OmpA family protein [Gammaproteobacteria bacterium]|nr:OmpA family protein [Gammaproteobacteria bacterium]